MAKTAVIYGAGISGLVAAIDLARHGFATTVYEKEPQIGGSLQCHPSIHMTPLMLDDMERLIGLNLHPCFSGVHEFRGYINRKKYGFSTRNLYLVERGPRPDSLDSFLYSTACAEGVEVEFSHPLTATELKTLPENTIIATAGYSQLVKNLRIPYVAFKQYDLHMKSDLEDLSIAYFGDFTTDYGYLSAKNGLLSAQLSGPARLSIQNLRRFQDLVKKTEGVDLPDAWSCIESCFPKKARLTTRYAGRRLVLAGDVAGFLDPFFGFGVAGALISGKLAAMFIHDPNKANQDAHAYLDRLNKDLLFHTMYWHLPLKNIVAAETFKLRDTPLSLFKRSIPGFTDSDWLKVNSGSN
jgi:flavin-dependent dehydrogenase